MEAKTYQTAAISQPTGPSLELRDFSVLPCKRKLQYITSSIDKDQVLRETFDKVQTLQQKNVFLLLDEVQIRLNAEECSPSSDLYRRPCWLTNRCSLVGFCFYVVSMVLGLQGGYTKFSCFLYLFDRRADNEYYMQRDWPAKSGLTPGSPNVVAHALVNLQNILFSPLHIKLGLFKIIVKAEDKNPGFQFSG
ncbi:hypothetical protein FHG87_006963 [Trinorchestia longiramus]|nr:hypothetical protein FHG87_006963 [Trinorchestia longiramus]